MNGAVIFGAGSVGRGLVGQLFCEAGYHVTFLEVEPNLVDALARDQSYPHVTVSNTKSVRTTIGPVGAIDATDSRAAVAALVSADLAATAVGARVLPVIAPTLATALARRIELDRPPLNLLLCENLHGAAAAMRTLVTQQLPQVPAEVLAANLGLLETSIGRMIPVPDRAVLAAEPTVIFAEPYKELPYDAAAVRGEPLDVPGLVADPHVRFSFYGNRKLYIHNMGHALTAYLGEVVGVATIAEAIEVPAIRYLVRAAMGESALALALSYRRPVAELMEHVDDLIHRFGNRALGDTVERVGRDPIRKMGADDRLVGAYMSAVWQASPTRHLSLAVAAGADALRRHENWSQDAIKAFLKKELRPSGLSSVQRSLLKAQIAGFAEGRDLTWQVDLIDRTHEAAAPVNPCQIKEPSS